MSNVWVVHDKGGMDFHDADRYGVVKTLFVDHASFDVRDAYLKCVEEFKSHGNANDWILPCGQQGLNIAAVTAFQQAFGRLNLLMFHAVKRMYVPQELMLDAKKKGDADEQSGR